MNKTTQSSWQFLDEKTMFDVIGVPENKTDVQTDAVKEVMAFMNENLTVYPTYNTVPILPVPNEDVYSFFVYDIKYNTAKNEYTLAQHKMPEPIARGNSKDLRILFYITKALCYTCRWLEVAETTELKECQIKCDNTPLFQRYTVFFHENASSVSFTMNKHGRCICKHMDCWTGKKHFLSSKYLPALKQFFENIQEEYNNRQK